MANENVIQATFDGFYKTYTEPSWFIDHGMELSISGIDLPDEFECHFSNSRSVAAKRQIGENGVVTIPDEYFLSNAAQIFCWIYLHPTVDSGVTEYEIVIPLLTRPNVDPAEPTQEQQDIVDQAIAALNVAMAETSADAESASASATAAQAAVDSVLNMTVSVDTLPSGSDASVTKSVVDDAVHLAFGIPQGAQGVQGEQGVQGPTGATPNFTIGTVQTLLPTQDATATITGTEEEPVLNLGIPKGYSGDANNLAADYSSTKTYAVGDYCIYNGSLYRCTTAIPTAEAWTAAHWTAAVLGDDIGDLKSAIDDVSKGNYDLGTWIPDTYIQANGNTNAYTGWKATNFIQVPPTDSLYIVSTASSQGSYNCFYNANKQKTGNAFSFSAGDNTITIPSGAVYFRLSMPNSVNVQVQTVIGNKVEKNTAAILKLTEDADKLITVVQTNATVGKYIYYDGTVYNDNSFMISDPVYIRAGSKIHLYGRGYLQNICMIAQTHADNKWHYPVVNSYGSTAKWYTFDVVRNGYYAFSGNKDTPFQLIITPSEQYPDNKISLSMFQKFGVIGDSYASGVIYIDYGVSVQKYECSWGQIMARKFGTQCTNYSSGGLSTRTWLTSSSGLTKLLNHEPEDIYYCALGINDYGQLGEDYLGSLEDITSHQSMEEYADSFYGNYGRIIENIKAHAPHALIVMFTCANTSIEIARRYSSAIIELANYYQIPYIVQAEDPFFATPIYTEMFGGHPTSIGYAGMANAFERLLQDCVSLNRDYFKGAYRYSD